MDRATGEGTYSSPRHRSRACAYELHAPTNLATGLSRWHFFRAAAASAQYGSCEEPIPYDNYSGTAAPGATVTITSPWSATTTATADSSGHWAAQVTFEAAPVDEPFTVTISSGGDSVGLGFVRTG